MLKQIDTVLIKDLLHLAMKLNYNDSYPFHIAVDFSGISDIVTVRTVYKSDIYAGNYDWDFAYSMSTCLINDESSVDLYEAIKEIRSHV